MSFLLNSSSLLTFLALYGYWARSTMSITRGDWSTTFIVFLMTTIAFIVWKYGGADVVEFIHTKISSLIPESTKDNDQHAIGSEEESVSGDNK